MIIATCSNDLSLNMILERERANFFDCSVARQEIHADCMLLSGML